MSSVAKEGEGIIDQEEIEGGAGVLRRQEREIAQELAEAAVAAAVEAAVAAVEEATPTPENWEEITAGVQRLTRERGVESYNASFFHALEQIANDGRPLPRMGRIEVISEIRLRVSASYRTEDGSPLEAAESPLPNGECVVAQFGGAPRHLDQSEPGAAMAQHWRCLLHRAVIGNQRQRSGRRSEWYDIVPLNRRAKASVRLSEGAVLSAMRLVRQVESAGENDTEEEEKELEVAFPAGAVGIDFEIEVLDWHEVCAVEDYQYYVQYTQQVEPDLQKKALIVHGGHGMIDGRPEWFQSNPFAVTKTVLRHAEAPLSDPMTSRNTQLGMKVSFTCSNLDGSIPTFMDASGSPKSLILGRFACDETLPEALEVCLLVMGAGEKSRCSVTHHGSALAMSQDKLTPNARADVAHVPLLQRAVAIFTSVKQDKDGKSSLSELIAATQTNEPEVDLTRLQCLLEQGGFVMEGEDAQMMSKASWIVMFSKATGPTEPRKEYIIELESVEWADGAMPQRGMKPLPKESEEEEQARVQSTLEEAHRTRSQGAQALVTGNMFQAAKMDAEALVAFRRACKLYSAAETMLMTLTNARQAGKLQKEAVKRNLGVVLNNHSMCLRKMALLAEKATYVPKVTVNLCNEVAKRCAKQAKDMSKYYLKARFQYVECLAHCGVEDDRAKGTKSATTEWDLVKKELKTIEAEKFFIQISKDCLAVPIKEKEKHAEEMYKQYRLKDRLIKSLMVEKKEETKKKEEAAKAKKGDVFKIDFAKQEEKEKKKEELRKKAAAEEEKKRAEQQRAAEIKRKMEEMLPGGGGVSSRNHSNRVPVAAPKVSPEEEAAVAGDLLAEATPVIAAAAVAATAVCGVGLWLWKIRSRLTKGPQ